MPDVSDELKSLWTSIHIGFLEIIQKLKRGEKVKGKEMTAVWSLYNEHVKRLPKHLEKRFPDTPNLEQATDMLNEALRMFALVDAIDEAKTEEPEVPERITNLEIFDYMRFRAMREETNFTLTPEFFAQKLDQGIRKMFGVKVTHEGDVVSDPKHLEVLIEWKAATTGVFAGKTGTQCSVCFEDFTEEYGRQRSELCCPCAEDLCRKCFTIHVTRTAAQCDDEGCSNWHVHCPTCAGQQTLTQDFFHHCHQTCVTNNWLG
jgi:hypothetical protein